MAGMLDFLFGRKVLKDVAEGKKQKSKSGTPAWDMDEVRKKNEEAAAKQKAVQDAIKKRQKK